ncbi:hypothetical protein [Pleionea sp. CnH1-48]|uniref:hypothetical protein n=1 Tax=Pleionea sp. CnH1-48 TaxID=2954494 RepID=UPI002097AB58|nr:hypothetical protein [Pleionea sp. CnH1-48]MCO7225184.1 hypothetical protein [Pleionea sp. CnH1-48]
MSQSPKKALTGSIERTLQSALFSLEQQRLCHQELHDAKEYLAQAEDALIELIVQQKDCRRRKDKITESIAFYEKSHAQLESQNPSQLLADIEQQLNHLRNEQHDLTTELRMFSQYINQLETQIKETMSLLKHKDTNLSLMKAAQAEQEMRVISGEYDLSEEEKELENKLVKAGIKRSPNAQRVLERINRSASPSEEPLAKE